MNDDYFQEIPNRTHWTDPEKTWVSKNTLASNLIGPGFRWDSVPFNFWWIINYGVNYPFPIPPIMTRWYSACFWASEASLYLGEFLQGHQLKTTSSLVFSEKLTAGNLKNTPVWNEKS